MLMGTVKGVTVSFEPLATDKPIDKGLTSDIAVSVPQVYQGARVIIFSLILDEDYSTLQLYSIANFENCKHPTCNGNFKYTL